MIAQAKGLSLDTLWTIYGIEIFALFISLTLKLAFKGRYIFTLNLKNMENESRS
jgi:hypothetical protein